MPGEAALSSSPMGAPAATGEDATSRDLVICLDGTRSEPERGPTNVARM
jgi:uncharacterized protein (DUF2235 family)